MSTRKFDRDSGVVDGGLIVLALFALLTAIINREWLYVLFAVWLIANLRLAALSTGWDLYWLERAVPADWTAISRKMSFAVYYILTYTLFARLFRDDLVRVGFRPLLRILQWISVPLTLAALVLEYGTFLPYLWASAAFGIVVLVFFLVRILAVTRSPVAMWYSASLGITLFATFYEIIAAALGIETLIGAINSVTAALFSSLMAALAIAEQMRQDRQERLKAQAELRSTYEAIPVGLFTLDADGLFLRTNPTLRQMLGLAHAAAGEHWGAHFEAGAWERLRNLVWDSASHELEVRGRTPPGNDKWFLIKATRSGEKIEGSLTDITERRDATNRLRFLADNDPLTGMLNRRGIEKAAEAALLDLAGGKPMALGYLDLDRFKLINDLFGHPVGDEVLRQVCDRVKSVLSPGQDVGRIGGDEFVVVFRDTKIAKAIYTSRAILERIVSDPYQLGDKAFQVKGSMGLIEVNPATSVRDAIAAADRACREAKLGHHDGLVVHGKSDAFFRERENELTLIERLGAGTVPDGMFLLMQPIMSLREPFASLNFEVLLRMRETDGRVTRAGKIMTTAENHGQSAVIDRWVLNQMLHWIDEHYDRLERTQFIAVNLSGASLNDERFIQDAFSMLARHRRSSEKLCIEITESVALHDLNNTRAFIDSLRDFGVRVALDDFGAGYTSFSYIRDLPADTIKIDGRFILGLNAHPANLAIVEAIVELAKNLGMKTIAEWAEDVAAIESLIDAGVDYVQGNIIGLPQEPDNFLAAQSSANFVEDEKTFIVLRNIQAKPPLAMPFLSKTNMPKNT